MINPQQRENNIINLQKEQEHYLRRVVRLNNGDEFIAINVSRSQRHQCIC